MRISKLIILGGALLLPFFVIPVSGMPFRLSREILAIWMGVGLVMAFIPSWWLRGLLALALAHLIINPASIAYWDMMLLCAFCGSYVIVWKMDEQSIECLLVAVCLVAVFQAALIFVQLAGLWETESFYPRGMMASSNDAGAFLALSLPAFAGKSSKLKVQSSKVLVAGALIVFGALIATRCTTAFIAVWFGSILWIILEHKIDLHLKTVVIALILLITGFFFLRVDPIQKTIQGGSRSAAWERTIIAIRDKPWGYGLGSYKELFPSMSANDQRIARLSKKKDGRYDAHAFEQAHNEYLQMIFELGWPFLLLIAGFFASFIHRVLRSRTDDGRQTTDDRQRTVAAACGLVILAVGCAGFFWLHLVECAMLAVMWLAVWDKSSRGSRFNGSRFNG